MELAGEEEASIDSLSCSDWDRPFTDKELQEIEVAFESAASRAPAKSPRLHHIALGEDDRTKSRRRLPNSILFGLEGVDCREGSDGDSCSAPRPRSFALSPCNRKLGFRRDTVKMGYPVMNFGGQVIYSRTFDEVDESASQILKLVESQEKEMGELVLGVDIEWKPSFKRGLPPGKAAVMQICGNMTHCYVMHIIHSGIPHNLRSLLEDSSSIKVGVGIDNDAVKVFRDHNVSIRSLQDLSRLAKQKLGGEPGHWSLSSLVEMLTCKQLLKPNKIRLGNWETNVLSEAQLQYAATDAFASWYLYQVLKTYPDKPEEETAINL
ncbi:hypothetical protein Dimus_029832 [Dionaea muscipula]